MKIFMQTLDIVLLLLVLPMNVNYFFQYNGNIIEELFNARTKDINGYNALSYEFNDYDDSGKIIWHTI